MTPRETEQALREAGLSLALGVRGQLNIRGPRSAYSDTLRAAVETHREALTAGLAAGFGGFAGFDIPHAGTRSGDLSLSRETSSHAGIEQTPQSRQTPQPSPAHEIASLRVDYTRDLPLPCTLLVRFHGRVSPSVLTSSAARSISAKAAGAAVWSPGEYELAAYAVQERRAFAGDVVAWDARKVATKGGWTLTMRDAIGDAIGLLEAVRVSHRAWAYRVPVGAVTLTWGQWLSAIGADLLSVECETQAVAIQASAAAREREQAGAML